MKKRIIFFSIGSIFVLGLTLFCLSFFVIHKEVKAVCLKAKNEYRKDCLASLIAYIESDNHTIRAKNSAIWALGQLANKKALPFLYELDNSLPENGKCSLDACLSKYELRKAIKWCEQGNITSWMYGTQKK